MEDGRGWWKMGVVEDGSGERHRQPFAHMREACTHTCIDTEEAGCGQRAAG